MFLVLSSYNSFLEIAIVHSTFVQSSELFTDFWQRYCQKTGRADIYFSPLLYVKSMHRKSFF